MKVKFVRDTVAAKRFVKAGEEAQLPKAEAQLLINMGKAEKASEDVPAAEPVSESLEQEHEVKHEPKPKREKKAQKGHDK